MTYVGILLITILVSFIIVRIGGFALQLTGIEPDVANFQALSAFSGAGFTTREAERVVTHRTRRRIVTTLIILGNAGLVTIMAALVAAVTTSPDTRSSFITVGIIILGIFALYALILRSRVGNKIVNWFRKPIMKRIMMEAPAFDEIYTAERDWGIHLVTVKKDSKNIGLLLADVIAEDIAILAIDKIGVTITKPDSKEKIVAGDRLLIYGNKKTIRRLFG